MIVEKKSHLKAAVKSHKHKKNGNNDVANVDKKTAHKKRFDYSAPAKRKAGERVGAGNGNDEQYPDCHCCYYDGIKKILSHMGICPGVNKVFEIETLWQLPRISVKFTVFFY